MTSSYSTATPLQEAAAYGDLATVESLLLCRPTEEDKDMALVSAAGKGHLEIAKILAPLCDPKANHSLALYAAVIGHHATMVAFLLPLSDPTTDDGLAFYAAVNQNFIEAVEGLLPFATAKQCSIGLESPAKRGHVETIKLLLPYVSDIGQLNDTLKLAAKHGQLAIVELLIPRSDPKDDSSHALYEAALNGHKSAVARLALVSDVIEVSDFLIPLGQWAALDLLAPHVGTDQHRLWIEKAPPDALPETAAIYLSHQRQLGLGQPSAATPTRHRRRS